MYLWNYFQDPPSLVCFDSTAEELVRDAQAFVVCYDVTNQDSYDMALFWEKTTRKRDKV